MSGKSAPTGRTYKVFVSSTFLDNEERRKLVIDAINDRPDMKAVAMERFTAASRDAADYCTAEAAAADVFVGILGWRYGFRPSDPAFGGKSVTELEYDAFLNKADGFGPKAALFFLLPDGSRKDYEKDVDVDPEAKRRLDAFRARIESAHVVTKFTDATLQYAVGKALDEWRQLDVYGAASPPPAPPDHVARYREIATRHHGELRLIGFETTIRDELRLDELFVELDAVADDRGAGRLRFANADEAMGELAKDGSPTDECVGTGLRLGDALSYAARRGRRGVLILGDPGSGKTTHLQHLLLAAYDDALRSAVGMEPNVVPVVLPLRGHLDALTRIDERGRGLSLSELVDAELRRLSDESGLHDRLPLGGAALLGSGVPLLMFDGLDEVADPTMRRRVAAWIAALPKQPDLQRARFVVTCRYAGFESDMSMGPDFARLHLRPLSEARSHEFIRRWHRKVAQLKDPKDPARAARDADEKSRRLIEKLKEPDFRSNRVATLTRNPLLLTIICLVHADKGQDLPSKRHLLYEECVKHLLWRASKRPGPMADFDPEDVRKLVQAAAWEMHRLKVSQADAAALSPVILEHRGRTKRPDLEPRHFLDAVRDVAGIFTGWSDASYGFLHLGFQELMTAQELHRRAFPGDAGALRTVARAFGDPWWREPTLLFLATADQARFNAFMAEALRAPGFPDAGDLLDHVLQEAGEKTPKPFVEHLEGRSASWWRRILYQLGLLRHVVDAPRRELILRALRKLDAAAAERFDLSAARTAPRTTSRSDRRVAPRGGVRLIAIPGGRFTQGSPATEADRMEREGPQRLVTLSPFWLAEHPVTNAQYREFLAASPKVKEPDYWADAKFNQDAQPVVGVSWDDADAYCRWAGLRLPTEAEWEYACRAGTATRFWKGDAESDLAEVGWFDGNSGRRLHVVGEKPANPWGLVDMHGNAWEWCADWFARNYPKGDVRDPTGPAKGPVYNLTGSKAAKGSRNAGPPACAAAARGGTAPAGAVPPRGAGAVRGSAGAASASGRPCPPRAHRSLIFDL